MSARTRIHHIVATAALALGLALCLAPAGGAAAQGYNVWYAQCLGDESSGETPLCTVEILLDPDQGEFVLYFVYRDEGDMPLVVSGGDLALGRVSIKADKKDPIETGACEVGLCYFEPPISTKLKDYFLRGRSAEVRIDDAAGETVLSQTITLNGFQKALFEVEAAARAARQEGQTSPDSPDNPDGDAAAQ